MTIQSIGTRFQDYQQYCDLVDNALAAFRSPLMNGLPMAKDARQLIEDKRLFFVRNSGHVLIFSVYDEYTKLYYAAQQNAVLAMPPVSVPIVADQVRLDTKRYPQHDALMERSAFRLARVNVGMERKLDDSLKRELYIRTELPEHVTVGFAMPGELFKIDRLLKSAFNPMLDELPSRDELAQMIRGGHVFVIRDSEKIAATMIRIPKGTTAMMHWIAVEENYRSLKLSGTVAYAGDLDSKKQGYHQVAIWVDDKAEGWIRTIGKRGYEMSKQRLYTFVYTP